MPTLCCGEVWQVFSPAGCRLCPSVCSVFVSVRHACCLQRQRTHSLHEVRYYYYRTKVYLLFCSVDLFYVLHNCTRGYRGGSPTAVQALQPCPLCCLQFQGTHSLHEVRYYYYRTKVYLLFCSVDLFYVLHNCTRGYRGGSPTAVQALQPCPLWEPSPSHPILL